MMFKIYTAVIINCFITTICNGKMIDHSRRTRHKKSSIFLNEFTVEISDDENADLLADQLATKYGFINLGQVGELEGFYTFANRRIRKRSLALFQNSHFSIERLKRDSRVFLVDQVRVLKRVKRSAVSLNLPVEDPNDPAWGKMWYMHCGGPNGTECPSSMRISEAWRAGYSGEGIVATILDDGIETTHPDLNKNYDPRASYDINSNDADPSPRYDPMNENKHGTRCAGVVAAVSDNGICSVGVAYKAKIGGVRMLDGEVTDRVEARSLGLSPNHIDIYSASWGPDDDGRTVEGPGPLAKAAFRRGVLRGRNGKGSIFVWASGNGGVPDDACSCDGYINSIYTIGISSASQTGGRPWYLEECASTLASTYSSGDITEGKVITTDLHHACTYFHTGTSASAPMAAGVIALMLQANYNLTWRDVQHIIVRTSNPKGLIANDWVMNGAGYNVSHVFGFGLMDAARLTQVAQSWETVPEQHECITTPRRAAKRIELNLTLFIPIDTNACSYESNEVLYLEHVKLHITLSHPYRGDLQIYLTSPSGTKSTILERRERDDSSKGFDGWDFMTTHHWGENPQGLWTLELKDVPPKRRRGRRSLAQLGEIRKWQLIFYGTREDPQPNFHYNKCDAYPQDQCHEQCVGCCGPSDLDCKVCANVATIEGQCVPHCNIGTFPDRKTNVCRNCWNSCERCDDSGPYNCTSCLDTHILLHGKCLKSCGNGQYLDTVSERCRKCDESCRTCEDQPENCVSCRDGYRHEENKCTPSCPSGTFLYARSGCRPCDVSCAECSRASASMCTACHPVLLLHKRMCIATCPRKFYPDYHTQTCELCHTTCKSCDGPNESDCIGCPSGQNLVGGKCEKTCKDGYNGEYGVNPCLLVAQMDWCLLEVFSPICCHTCQSYMTGQIFESENTEVTAVEEDENEADNSADNWENHNFYDFSATDDEYDDSYYDNYYNNNKDDAEEIVPPITKTRTTESTNDE